MVVNFCLCACPLRGRLLNAEWGWKASRLEVLVLLLVVHRFIRGMCYATSSAVERSGYFGNYIFLHKESLLIKDGLNIGSYLEIPKI